MATENIPYAETFLAGADLSSDQYKFVKQTTAAEPTVEKCDTDGEFAIGVLQNKPTSGQAAEVACYGRTKVVVASGETIAPGDFVGTNNAGFATKVDATATGADLGDYMIGKCYEGATGPAIASIIITNSGYVVTS